MRVAASRGAIKVLHVVPSLDPGGIETWLMRVVRRAHPRRARIDFAVHSGREGAYEREALRAGCRVEHSPDPRRRLMYAEWLRGLLAAGRYDVAHAHVDHYGGWVARIAARAGVPVRVVHSHNDFTGRPRGFAPKAYHAVCKGWIRRHATLGLAPSRAAADWLFGPGWGDVMPLGIDLSAFRGEVDRARVGVPHGAFAVAHVGRFDPQKNHAFLVRIAAEMPEASFVLVGRGALESEVRGTVAAAALEGRFVFAGMRSDIADFLRACDAFVLPSIHEGLGLAAVEAQAAGLRCVISDAVPAEAVVVPGLVRRLALSAPAAEWVRALREPPDVGRDEALAAIEASPYEIGRSVDALLEAYRQR